MTVHFDDREEGKDRTATTIPWVFLLANELWNGFICLSEIVSCTNQSKYNAFVHVHKYSGLLSGLYLLVVLCLRNPSLL